MLTALSAPSALAVHRISITHIGGQACKEGWSNPHEPPGKKKKTEKKKKLAPSTHFSVSLRWSTNHGANNSATIKQPRAALWWELHEYKNNRRNKEELKKTRQTPAMRELQSSFCTLVRILPSCHSDSVSTQDTHHSTICASVSIDLKA